jgi:hypothetical protein
MKKAVLPIVAALVLGCLSYGAASRHVVKTDKGVVVLTKRFLTFTDTLVDVRRWTSADFDAHPELKRAMIAQGYRDMLMELRAGELEASLGDVADKAGALAEGVAAKIAGIVDGWLAEISTDEQPDNPPK